MNNHSLKTKTTNGTRRKKKKKKKRKKENRDRQFTSHKPNTASINHNKKTTKGQNTKKVSQQKHQNHHLKTVIVVFGLHELFLISW